MVGPTMSPMIRTIIRNTATKHNKIIIIINIINININIIILIIINVLCYTLILSLGFL